MFILSHSWSANITHLNGISLRSCSHQFYIVKCRTLMPVLSCTVIFKVKPFTIYYVHRKSLRNNNLTNFRFHGVDRCIYTVQHNIVAGCRYLYLYRCINKYLTNVMRTLNRYNSKPALVFSKHVPHTINPPSKHSNVPMNWREKTEKKKNVFYSVSVFVDSELGI